MQERDLVKVRSIFSTRVLKDISMGLRPLEVSEAWRILAEADAIGGDAKLRDLFDVAFQACLRSKRVEYVYKNALVEKLILGRHSLRTSSAHFEVRIHSAKLDVLFARQFLAAYEVKTERDELSRLKQQVESYRRVCREVWVLAAEKHLANLARSLPEEVGIATLSSRYRISRIRPATQNAEFFDRSDLLRLLRKEEQTRVLEELGGAPSQVPNTRLFRVLAGLAESQSVEWLEARVTHFLRKRGARNSDLALSLPRSLSACALAQDLTAPRARRLIDAFATTQGVWA